MDVTVRAVLLTAAFVVFVVAALRDGVAHGRLVALVDLVAAGLALVTLVWAWDAWVAA